MATIIPVRTHSPSHSHAIKIFPVGLISEYLTLPQVETSPYTFKWAASTPTNARSNIGLSLLLIEQLLVALEDIVTNGRGKTSVVNMAFGGSLIPEVEARQCVCMSYN